MQPGGSLSDRLLTLFEFFAVLYSTRLLKWDKTAMTEGVKSSPAGSRTLAMTLMWALCFR